MKVLHINSFTTGGAAVAAINLHLSLLQYGVESHFLHLYPSLTFVPNEEFYQPRNIAERFYCSIIYRWQQRNNLKALSVKSPEVNFSSIISPYHFLHKHLAIQKADIINLHWIAGFVDYGSFFKNVKKPLVWTLHDENPYLGGFHYEYEQYFNKSDSLKEKSSEILSAKRKIFYERCIKIVAPSNWILNKAKLSNVFSKSKYNLIPNGIDTEIFSPRNKFTSKQKLGVPKDKFMVLFVADSINDKRKGISYLIDALLALEEFKNDIVLYSVGRGNLEIDALRSYNFGYVTDKSKMADIYSSADLFIIPSVADNLPNTVLESLACGTPVLGFNTGGIPDMVIENKTGFLVEQGNSELLATKIKFALKNPELLKKMGNYSAVFARNNFSLDMQALKYISLYKKILKTH